MIKVHSISLQSKAKREKNEMSTERLFFNGINAAGGDYLLPAMTPRQISAIAQGEVRDADHLRELRSWYRR